MNGEIGARQDVDVVASDGLAASERDEHIAVTEAPETVTPIKPSEALRLGRLTFPTPLFDSWTSDDDPRAACAWYAIHVGFGGDAASDESNRENYWSWGLPNRAPCPYRCRGFDRRHGLGDTVMHLNDDHRWSDDQIVAWLEGLGL